MLGLMGPNSRAVLQELGATDWSSEAFPFGTRQEVTLAGVPVTAMRLSYVGALGWELYVSEN